MEAVLSLSSDPLNLFQDISLSSTDREILSCVDGKHSLKDILSLSSLGDLETLKTIHALLSSRIIEIKKSDTESPQLTAEEIIADSGAEVDQRFIERLDYMDQNYETLGYYGVLGIPESASLGDIKKAYYRVAKEFHPDRHFSSQSEDLKEKLNRIFFYITEAYKTISDPVKRKEYDKHFSLKPEGANSNQNMALERFQEGKLLMREKNFPEAAKLFAQAIYLDHSVAKYHYFYGNALCGSGKHREAVEAIRQALRLDPLNTNYVAELGHIYLNLGFMTRATATFEKALKLSPSNEKALEGMRKMEANKQRVPHG